jgi:hypothetical protein
LNFCPVFRKRESITGIQGLEQGVPTLREQLKHQVYFLFEQFLGAEENFNAPESGRRKEHKEMQRSAKT